MHGLFACILQKSPKQINSVHDIASESWSKNNVKQAGAELGQAQLKLGLDFTSTNFNE